MASMMAARRAMAFGRRQTRAFANVLPTMGWSNSAVAAGSRRVQQQSPVMRAFASSSGPHPSESFLSGTSSVYVEAMYRNWKLDPSSVHVSWREYFANVEKGMEPGAAFLAPPSVQSGVAPVASTGGGGANLDTIRALHLVRAYQVAGHKAASLDPLNLVEKGPVEELEYTTYGFTEADLDREFDFAGLENIAGFLGTTQHDRTTLRELLSKLKQTYCNTIGYEYMHIHSPEVCNWIRERIELPPKMLSKEERLSQYERLANATQFEDFLGLKYGSHKRFGLDGMESLIPGIKTMFDRAAEHGLMYAVLGMPHRGRLNVLCNLMGKPVEEICHAFDDVPKPSKVGADWNGSGDVKYHLGHSCDITTKGGKDLHLCLMPNPSHLEAVNPVVVGKVRSVQDHFQDEYDQHMSMGVLLHGDAAFAGQGIVTETLALSDVPNYTTGGTIHVICNNQIGFTTLPTDGRGSHYASDIGKGIEVPIFHVNADDVEGVCRVFELAADYRATFLRDCIIDLIGFRKYGHNEGDEPNFTQPGMYKAIKAKKSIAATYKAKLLADGDITAAELEAIEAAADASLRDSFARRNDVEEDESWLSSQWGKVNDPRKFSPIRTTGMDVDYLKQVGTHLHTAPEGFNVQRTLSRQLAAKKKALESGENIDWGLAEGLAFATLVLEGSTLRLSGQDVERGTFSHRHAKWHDQKTFDTYMPLKNMEHLATGSQGLVHIGNSILSEFAVLGFDYGYSMAHPNQLVLWEAQFGDFANGAQIMIDQFISSGERKWLRMSGLVMLLPHGYDGGGPEHSSCRIERYLQAVDEVEHELPGSLLEQETMQVQHTNWQVVNCTTPANYFHVLRRQLHRDFRKPLIIATPKSLLRHPQCVSKLEDMGPGTRFQPVIPDTTVDAADVKTLVFTCGKLYYDLENYRTANDRGDVAIARLEQIAPFPFDDIAEQMAKYPNAKVVWAQEEPRNMGAWTFVRPRIQTSAKTHDLPVVDPVYAGRAPSASTSTGFASVHKQEQAAIVEYAFNNDEVQYELVPRQ